MKTSARCLDGVVMITRASTRRTSEPRRFRDNVRATQEGLPTDPLSIQNGILVTRSSRFPLLIDSQGQAVGWITCREKERLPAASPTVQLLDPKIKDKLEFAMQEGKAFIVLGVENEIDPMFDPVLEKEYVQKGRR